MLWLLILNTLVEGASGVGMFVSPGTFFHSADPVTIYVARSFGLALCSIAILSAAMIRIRRSPSACVPGLLALTAYHVASLIVLTPGVGRGLTPPPVPIIHAALGAGFCIVVVQSLRRAASERAGRGRESSEGERLVPGGAH